MMFRVALLFCTVALGILLVKAFGFAGVSIEAARLVVAFVFTLTAISLTSRVFFGKSPLITNRMYR